MVIRFMKEGTVASDKRMRALFLTLPRQTSITVHSQSNSRSHVSYKEAGKFPLEKIKVEIYPCTF